MEFMINGVPFFNLELTHFKEVGVVVISTSDKKELDDLPKNKDIPISIDGRFDISKEWAYIIADIYLEDQHPNGTLIFKKRVNGLSHILRSSPS